MNISEINNVLGNGTSEDRYRILDPDKASTNFNGTHKFDYGESDVFAAARIISQYYLWPIFAVGFPGNLASIITIFRMRSVGSFTLYVVLLAIMDNCALLVKIIVFELFRHEVNIGASGCRALIFLATFCTTYANWILVLMSGERLIAVRFPLKMQKYLDHNKSIIWICVVGVFIFGAYIPVLWYYNYENNVCSNSQASVELSQYLHWSNVSLSAFIPFIFMTVFNVLIMRVIRQSFRLRNTLCNVNSTPLARRSSCHDMSTQRQIMLMLFTTAFVFVIFVFPLCALTVAGVYIQHTQGTLGYDVTFLCGQIAFVLFDSTHALNFYLYFLSARKFRNHFLRMTSCKSSRDTPTNLQPIPRPNATREEKISTGGVTINLFNPLTTMDVTSTPSVPYGTDDVEAMSTISPVS